MYLQWSGGVSFIFLMIMFVFVCVCMYLIRYFYGFMHIQAKDQALKRLINCSLFIMSFSLILVVVNQAIKLNFIVFTSERNHLIFNFITSAVVICVGLYSLYNVESKLKLVCDKKKPN